jgi:hypothetical protein
MRDQIADRQSAVLHQQLMQTRRERRDAARAATTRRLLPVLIATESKDKRERLRGDDVVRRIAECAQQVQRDRLVVRDQTLQKIACAFHLLEA